MMVGSLFWKSCMQLSKMSALSTLKLDDPPSSVLKNYFSDGTGQ